MIASEILAAMVMADLRKELASPDLKIYKPYKPCPYPNCKMKFSTGLMERCHLEWHKEQSDSF